MSDAFEMHYYYNAANAAFNAAETLCEDLLSGKFDLEGDTSQQRRQRSGIKHEAMKAASVNCRLAQEIYMLIGRDMGGRNGRLEQYAEEATELVGEAKGLEEKRLDCGGERLESPSATPEFPLNEIFS